MTTGDQLRLLVVEKSKHDAESLAAVPPAAGHSIEYSHKDPDLEFKGASA